ncbi:hypothetical protein KP509_07G098600 [Ceratopteris richardii]|uniref:Aldose 1-epimerase n=1 Tax=Ceratopteris richardii TaxID=49495 RepID=A0A8T2UJP6_CERRI|nr:hypothetical protein KP509_07G098600 [Ceratopteris richardii]
MLTATSVNPNVTLHGGKKGFDKVLWGVKRFGCEPDPFVEFCYRSFDGEEGFPGDVDVSITYTLSGDFELRTEMEALPINKATPISLAQHTYWNFAGHDSGDILGHYVCIQASHITPVNEHLIPKGDYLPVHDTPFDFRNLRQIRESFGNVPGGYDHNYVLENVDNDRNNVHFAARVKDMESGRVMDLFTNAPGIQFYTGNFISEMEGKNGSKYYKHSGLCLETEETHGFPNAVNQSNFVPVVYRPGQVYKHCMIHVFYRMNRAFMRRTVTVISTQVPNAKAHMNSRLYFR